MPRPTDANPTDPLYRTTALPHVVRLPVLGIPVVFMTNSAEIRDAVQEWFGMWKHLDAHPDLVEAGDARVRIVLHEGTEGRRGRVPMRYRMPDGDRVIVHTPGSMGMVDATRGDAVAYVTRALLTDRGHLQYGILEMLTLVLVTVRDRLPLHAALVARGDVAVMLTGPSGLGKSTLAYQARRSGWTLLADDGVYAQANPRLRLWGGPRRLYLPPDAGTWFPELAEREPQIQANGKTKIAVEHAHDWEKHGPPVVDRVAVCVLGRAEGKATLERINADTVSASLRSDLAATHDLYGDAPSRIIPRLAADGGWRLALTGRPADAAPLLDALTEQFANG